MYGKKCYKSIVLMGVWGHSPQELKLLTFLLGKTLEMDKKLGIILKNKGLFRNLALFECFF